MEKMKNYMEDKDSDKFVTIPIIVSEVIFLLLPLFVLIILDLTSENFISVITSRDLGLVSIVCWGQGLVKTVSGLIKSSDTKNWMNVSLYVSIVIALGITPSLIFYSKIHINRYVDNSIYWVQGISFILSFIHYCTVGLFANDLLNSNNT